MSLDKCIHALSKQQFDLRCERAMYSLHTIKNDEYLLELKNKYSLFLQKQKNHYHHFFEIINPKYTKISPPTKKMNIDEGIKDIRFKSLISFIEKLMENDAKKIKTNLNNPEFTFTLIFSLFPAISSYFHINLTPTLEISSDTNYFQVHNYSNVFLYISEQIKNCDGNKEKEDFYQQIFDLFMIPMFASPLFVNFCISFFQPIFSELQNRESNEGFKDFSIFVYLQTEFERYFNFYLHRIPAFIIINLKASNDPSRTLRKSFFDIALKNAESSQAYGLFHYSRPPSEFLLKSLRYVFTNLQEVIDTFVARFMSVSDVVLQQMSEWKERDALGELNILTCACSETKLTNKIDDISDSNSRVGLALAMKDFYFEENVCIEQNKNIFDKILLSTADIELINYIQNCNVDDVLFKLTPKGLSDSFYYIQYNPDGKIIDDDSNNDDDHEKDLQSSDSIDMTIRDSPIDITPNLRHLLQNSDPLPNFKEVPHMTIEEFFNEYLVRRGPSDSLPQRKKNYKIIFSLLQKREDSRINQILNSLPKTTLQQDTQIQILAIASLVKKKLDAINGLYLEINNLLDTLDNVILLSKKESEVYFQKFKFGLNIDYIKNPKLFENDVQINVKNLNKKIFSNPSIVLMKMIDKAEDKSEKSIFRIGKAKIIYRPLFLDFANSSNVLIQLDSKLNYLLKNFGANIVEGIFKTVFPLPNESKHKELKFKFLIQKVNEIPKIRKEILEIAVNAFADYSIIRKVELYNKFLREINIYINEEKPDYVGDIGPDELNPITSAIVIYANPSCIASNLKILMLLITKFVKSDITDLAISTMVSISSVLIDVVRILKKEGNAMVQSQDEFTTTLSQIIQ